MKIYISGPMTGHADFNYPTFEAAADRLRAAGHEPVSPTAIGQRDDWDWWRYMDAAIDMQRGCDAIYMLPGWRESRGATVEWHVAKALGQRIWGMP